MNELEKTFGEQKRWVSWSYQTVGGRQTKVPFGKSDDPSTWHTLEQAQLIQGKDPNKGVGLMFGLKKQLLGIDIDHCLTDGVLDYHEEADKIFELIKVADTYCEISPSGTGLHLFLLIDEPLDLIANKHAPFELYTNRRYFTVTFNPFGIERPVRTVSLAEANDILSVTGYPWARLSDEALRPAPVRSETTFDDDDLVKKMFSAKGGAKIKALYDGDTSAYNNDHSNADMALLSHLAFWTQGDKDQMERLWLASPLGLRAKTQERADYRDRSIKHALDNCKEYYKPKKTRVAKSYLDTDVNPTVDTGDILLDDLGLHFSLDKEGNRKYSLVQENINILLDKYPLFAGRFRYDEFHMATQILTNGKWEQQRDIHEINIQSEISKILPMFNRVSPLMVQRAITFVANKNRFDSARDYVLGLTWDKVDRISQWLQNVFGVDDDEYTQKVGANWMKGLAHRMTEPGCQFDYILVVEGAQGMRKSSAFRELVRGEWHLETERSPAEKDFLVEMAGKAIIELSEGQSNATIDVKKMKSIITKRKDTYRSPYGRTAEDHPRHSVFCMTTNDDEYLKDTTGDRRWWPVTSTKMADIEYVKAYRDQLIAEAYYRISVLNETTYEVPHDVALERQEDRRQKDPNTDAIVQWYQRLPIYTKKDGISVLDVFVGAFFNGITPANISITRIQQMSIASVLKSSLHLDKVRVMKDAVRTHRYYDPKLASVPNVFDLEVEGTKVEKVEEKEAVPVTFEDF